MKWFWAMMAVSGFWLIFGGVEMVEVSQDWYGMMIGLSTSLIGGLTLLASGLGFTATENRDE